MVLALVWLAVIALVAIWSFAAWVLHALAAWALANAGALTSVPGLVDTLNLPQWIAPWLPPEVAATLPAMVATLEPVVNLMVGWAPAISGSLSTLAWMAWALGSFVILALGLVASVLVVRYRGRSLRMPSVGGFMHLKTNREALMLYATLKTLHVLSIIVWIGGMVFAHFFLRPAVARLEPPLRLQLMHEVLGRFFRAVLAASALALATGLWMLGRVAKQAVQSGGSFEMPIAWTVMSALGLVMFAIFLFIRWGLYPRLGRAVAQSDWAAGAASLAQVRQWVAINLSLGLVVVVVTLLG